VTIRVFVVSNFLVLREALECVLKANPQRLSLVGVATDCDQAILDIALQQAEVILLDI